MKLELDLPRALVKFYDDYSEAVGQTREESVRQVLSDFAFGAIDLGFVSPVKRESTRSPRP